jgi:hypothetical protein
MAESFLLGNAPIPITDPIARPKRRDKFGEKQTDPLEGTMSDAWVDYISKLVQTVQASATRISAASRTDEAAAISATDISNGGLKRGLYRVSYHARIIQAASVSSSLTITISWTDGGVAQSQSGAAITGNTTATRSTPAEGDFLIHADTSSPLRYATAYASVGGTEMHYRLDVVLEVVQVGAA